MQSKDDEKQSQATMAPVSDEKEKPTLMPLYGVDRPFFHIDLHDAVDAAVRDAKRQDERGHLGETAVCSRARTGRDSPV
jgi:sodium-independent sulfate anion transporter 11